MRGIEHVFGLTHIWVGPHGRRTGIPRRLCRAAANRAPPPLFGRKRRFATSALVRNVPTGPFIMVNMALRRQHREIFRDFVLGMAVGYFPAQAPR